MNSRTIDVVTDWETVAVPDGYEGLHQLADAEFSGAVSAGTTWAFFLNGRVVGVFEGDIGDFEGAESTAYRAADPSLPLLFAMQERGGDTRARYYTNETPLSDVDQTLSSGGFTGYVELSENVLSGDYYVVYHGGKSMSAAFVGNSERLITGEEAFETADDEVGIYEVVDVDIELVDIPEPSADDATDGADEAESRDDQRPDDTPEPADPTIAATDAIEEETASAAGAEPGTDPPEDDDGAVAEEPIEAGEADGEPSPTDPGSQTAEPDAGVDSPESTVPDVAPDGVDEAADGMDDTGEAGTVGGTRRDETAEETSVSDTEPEETSVSDTEPEETSVSDTEPEETAEEEPRSEQSASDAHTDEGRTADATRGDGTANADDPSVERTEPAVDVAVENETAPTADRGAADSEGAGGEPAEASASPVGGTAGEPERADDASGPDAALSAEERWREARSIPSLDPDRTSDSRPSGEPDDGDAEGRTSRERTAQMQRQRTARRAARDETDSHEGENGAAEPPRKSSRADSADLERLKRRLSRARERIESLEAERNELEAERETLREEREERRERIEELEAERGEYRERIQELESECESLRAEVERLESEVESATGVAADSQATSMSADQALSGTNIFVRYDRKGETTLKHAHAGEASRSDVAENLRLEHHTTFETDGVVVDEQPYEAFLHESTEYAFAEWVVSDLLYEIGETGNRSELAGVFDVIPDVDRIELYGTVDVETDDEVERRDFDVICRDKMGDPLFVADINASRNATTEAMVGSLVENTATVAEHEESLAAGFYVTESFYEPGALETVAEETGGGILSRSNKRSYVKLSRKRGYHLCLVEARDGEFHLNVPDL